MLKYAITISCFPRVEKYKYAVLMLSKSGKVYKYAFSIPNLAS